tara:strand:- start:31289 stop:31567 length:279 start_codon:yes stop_codon:yes gene_type:complete
MIPEALKQAKSIEEVVQIIDSGGTESSSPEELAAAYAYSQTMKKESPDKEELQVEFRRLMEEGAMFDYALALEYAEAWLIDALNKATASQGL